MKELGQDPQKINPLIPTELVIDHSIQADFAGVKDAYKQNENLEFERNGERFKFLKWGQKNFKNFTIVPPGSGIVHQVNLEYLARVVFQNEQNMLYPDSLVGADSHTTMINGLGIVGWGVGGIEAESAMLGQSLAMVLPKVVGVKLTGKLSPHVNATDLVLTITEILRKQGVVGKFVEFFGEGIRELSLPNRATISNMCPEYGATIGLFPVDEITLDYMRVSGRQPEKIKVVEEYLRKTDLFMDYNATRDFSQIVEVDLSKIVNSLAGPKRPQDRVSMSNMKTEFTTNLTNKVGFKGFGLTPEAAKKKIKINYNNKEYSFDHGSVVIAAITSCTNTSNPEVMLAAGLLAKNAVERGMTINPFIKSTLSPGSGVVTKYLEKSDTLRHLEKLGFYIAGYGCMTCIGNSGDLHEAVSEAITKNDIVAASVLSGNRNFEGRVHNLVRSNYLASPPLVVAYALAGTVNIDLEKEPIGKDSKGNDVFLRDIWPSKEQINDIVNKSITPQMHRDVYSAVVKGSQQWQNLQITDSPLYTWDEKSTYIKKPPFFDSIRRSTKEFSPINNARCLLLLGDSITTDHISPAGNISVKSVAARYLMSHGVQQKDFNQYGTRRGNFEVMARGTFANVRIVNKLVSEVGPKTVHVPSGKVMDIYDAVTEYKKTDTPLIVLAGKEYGSGSSRDWAAKYYLFLIYFIRGPMLLNVKTVIAESYERIHRSNLAGMGILPTEYINGENAEKLGKHNKFIIL